MTGVGVMTASNENMLWRKTIQSEYRKAYRSLGLILRINQFRSQTNALEWTWEQTRF